MTPASINSLSDSQELREFKDQFEMHNSASSSVNKMHRFWHSYIQMVSLLLRLIRATREGNWPLHLACVKDMLPWLFAYDRTNYARYLPLYLCDMLSLGNEHSVTNQAFQAGDFVVQRSARNGFAQVAVDQTIGQTINWMEMDSDSSRSCSNDTNLS